MDMGDRFCPVWGSKESSLIFTWTILHMACWSADYFRDRSEADRNKSSQETTYILFSVCQNFLSKKMSLESFLFIVFPVSSCSACQMNIITDRKLHLFKIEIELPLPSPPNLYLKGLEGCRLQTTVYHYHRKSHISPCTFSCRFPIPNIIKSFH